MDSRKTIRFIDLFAGMGGTRIAFEHACKINKIKSVCVFTSEIKSYAIEALKENFIHKKLMGDIRKINEEDIPDFDVLLGGFPCQAFSSAGQRKGFLDTRGTLFFEIERILKAKKPAGFILENVEGLINHDKEKPTDKIGRTLNTILQSLKNIGYKVTWKMLDSKNFGVAQSRKRIYIVGALKKEVSLENFIEKRVTFGQIREHGLEIKDSHFTRCLLKHFKPKDLYGKSIKDKRGGDSNIHSWTIGLKGEITKEQTILIEKLFKERRKKHWAEEIGIDWMDGMPLTISQIKTFSNVPNLKILLDDLVNKGYLVKEHPKKLVVEKIGNLKHQYRVEDNNKPLGYNIVSGKLSFEFTKIIDDKDIAPTLVAMDVSKLGVVENNGIRQLSLRECLRLFGYPESYTLNCLKNKKKQIQYAFDLLGNTVVVKVVESVADRLLKSI